MPSRVMFVQLKTGFNTDQGPSWISMVRFTKTWATAYWHGRELIRAPRLLQGNFYDLETEDEYWVSGPRRDRGDARYGRGPSTVDEDVRGIYEEFLKGGRLPGREKG